MLNRSILFDTKSHPVFDAIKNGETETAIQLLEKENNLELHDYHLYTSLHWAAITGNKPLVEYLIAKGANIHAVNEVGELPFHYAAWLGHIELVQLFIAHGVDVNQLSNKEKNALQGAIKWGHQDVVGLLKTHGAVAKDWLTFAEWDFATRNNQLDDIKHIPREAIRDLTQEKIDERLMYCLNGNNKKENLPVVKYLLDLGGNLDYLSECTEIFQAQEFLVRGADINKVTYQEDWHRTGTLLQYAIIHGNIKLIQFALNHQADVSVKNRNDETIIDLLNNTWFRWVQQEEKLKSHIFFLLVPYLLDKKMSLPFDNRWFNTILETDISLLTEKACKHFILEIGYFLKKKNEWVTQLQSSRLASLYEKIVHQLYPNYVSLYPKIIDIQHIRILTNTLLTLKIEEEKILSAFKFFEIYDHFDIQPKEPLALAKEKADLLDVKNSNGFDQRQILYALAYIFKDCKEVYVPHLYELANTQRELRLATWQQEGYRYVTFPLAANHQHHINVWIELGEKEHLVNLFDSLVEHSMSEAAKKQLKILLGDHSCIIEHENSFFLPQNDNWSCGVYAVAHAHTAYLNIELRKIPLDVDFLAKKYYRAANAFASIKLKENEKIEQQDRYKRILLESIEQKRFADNFYQKPNEVEDILKPLADFLQQTIWGNLDRQDLPDNQQHRQNQQNEVDRIKEMAVLLREFIQQKINDPLQIGHFILQVASLYSHEEQDMYQRVINRLIMMVNFENSQRYSKNFGRHYQNVIGMMEANLGMMLQESNDKANFLKQLLNIILISPQASLLKELTEKLDCEEYHDKITKECPEINKLLPPLLITIARYAIELDVSMKAEKERIMKQEATLDFESLDKLIKNNSHSINRQLFFVKKYLKSIQSCVQFRAILELLPREERPKIANDCKHLIIDHRDLLEVIKLFPLSGRIDFIKDQINKIQNNNDLSEMVIYLMSQEKLELAYYYAVHHHKPPLTRKDIPFIIHAADILNHVTFAKIFSVYESELWPLIAEHMKIKASLITTENYIQFIQTIQKTMNPNTEIDPFLLKYFNDPCFLQDIKKLLQANRIPNEVRYFFEACLKKHAGLCISEDDLDQLMSKLLGKSCYLEKHGLSYAIKFHEFVSKSETLFYRSQLRKLGIPVFVLNRDDFNFRMFRELSCERIVLDGARAEIAEKLIATQTYCEFKRGFLL